MIGHIEFDRMEYDIKFGAVKKSNSQAPTTIDSIIAAKLASFTEKDLEQLARSGGRL